MDTGQLSRRRLFGVWAVALVLGVGALLGVVDPARGQGRGRGGGGSWRDRPIRCRSAFRVGYQPWQKVYNVGFRVICEDPAPPKILATRAKR